MMKRLTWFLLITLFTNHVTWTLPRAEAVSSNETLQFGRLQFYAGNYAESLDKVNKAIDGGNLSLEDLASAYYLKARCEARRDNKRSAVKAFCKMYDTEYPIIIVKSEFTATEMKAFREATEKCGPKETSTPAAMPTPTSAPAPAQTQVSPAPVETAPVENATSVTAPVQTAPPAVASSTGGKRWYRKPFSWIYGAGVLGLVYLLATNDSDRVLADPDAQ